ncbi:MAG: LysM peptidoglycan-binding domain-containing protein [Bacilli bacterium]|nr:LysM peptidoglycan-binding domain-containing protein [Bacilli bacterium]
MAKVVIDPGHGGVDSGAVGSDILEKDYNLQISRYMYDRFRELGVPVYLTRDSDVTLEPTARVNRVLSFFGNDPDVVVISNHLNAGGGDGAEIIYALRNDSKLANTILNNIGDTGQNTRRVYQRRLPSNSTKDYYFMHRNTGNTEPVIVEYGFIDNASDVAFLKDNYKELAEAVIKSVLEYKNVPYTAPETVTTDTYKVVAGDTLYSIANKLDTSVSELKEINNLSTNVLKIGQILKIPTKVVDIGDTELYQVKAGDTLYSIAKKYNISVNELKTINNLTNNDLAVGQLLNVPSGLSLVNTYVVEKGDTLYSIAKKFDISVNKLKEYNELTNNLLNVGQKLIIPIEDDTTYVVKKGDTIYSIAREFNTTVDKIKRLNNLENNILSIGQILIVKEV